MSRARRCKVAGCDRLEEMIRGGKHRINGLCQGHRYRLKRGLPLDVPLDPALAHRVTSAELLRRAAKRWVREGTAAAHQALLYAGQTYGRRRLGR